MKGYHAEEISNLNDEELDNLINALIREKNDRHEKEKENLLSEFEKMLDKAKEKGYNFYFYEDEPINIQDIVIV